MPRAGAAARIWPRRSSISRRPSAERQGLQADANLRAMLARLYIVNAAYDKAIPLLSDLVRQEPGWQDGAGLLVDAYVSAGRRREAIAWLEQARARKSAALCDARRFLRPRASAGTRRRRPTSRRCAVSPRSFDLRVRYASMLMNAGGVENVLKARTRCAKRSRCAAPTSARCTCCRRPSVRRTSSTPPRARRGG